MSALPTVTGLKVLKNYVYADVLLGYLADQGRVAVNVRASVADDEVAEAMKPLLDVLARRAHAVVRTADLSEQIDAGVRAELDVIAEDERSRVRRNAARQLEVAIREVERALDDAKRTDVPHTHTIALLDRTKTALRGLTERE